MSISIYLDVPSTATCPHCGTIFEAGKPHTVYAIDGMTHNLGAMWAEAGIEAILYDSAGQTAGKFLARLNDALELMCAEPARFEKHNPPNGWGNYRGAIECLKKIFEAFKNHPNGIIRVSK